MITDIQAYRQSFRARLQRDFEQRETLRKQAIKAVFATAPAIITRYPAIRTAYLFGSILRPGAFRSDSDIDIAIEGGTAEDYFALWRDLQEALPDWFIDLRDLPPNTQFTQRVYETGKKIYGGANSSTTS
jgi:predicted nucleotidyltransferase